MLSIVGFGPGGAEYMTLEAKQAIQESECIIGYTVYVELIQDLFPDKTFLATGMRQEEARCRLAIEETLKGRSVALVCSGDSGVYGMASLIYELAEQYDPIEIRVVAGVTAALSGGAVLGSPLTNDFAVISLSDLLTPYEVIENRLTFAAQADFVICLYNPSSKKRSDYLAKACDILLKFRDKNTVCGYVKQIGREEQESRLLTLEELRDTAVDMFTTVFIGNSTTRILQGKMVTPRGYRIHE